MVTSAGFQKRCGVEQWQLVGLITRRSQVQVLPPLLNANHGPEGHDFCLTRRTAIDRNLKPGGFCMNRSSLGSLALNRAITRFLNFKTAAGLPDRSVDSYKHILKHWAEYAGKFNSANSLLKTLTVTSV